MSRGKRRLETPKRQFKPVNPFARATGRHIKVAAVAAPLATVAAVGIGVAAVTAPTVAPIAADDLDSSQASAIGQAAGAASISETAISSAERTASVSRSFNRVSVPEVQGTRWATRTLKLRLTPTRDARSAGDFDSMEKIAITGTTRGDYAQVVVDNKVYWVTAQYLAKKKPVVNQEQSPDSGISGAPCPDGSSIEGGLQPAAIKVYRAVCAAFPEITSYGGQDGHGEHVNGQAIDFMISGSSGDRLKDYLYANRYEFGLFDIIWEQQIWTIERDGEGFRGMSDRGSATANHFDHVHIKVL